MIMDEEIPTNFAKISGYLHKKGKMRMVWSWKKYWFVLEGRLLLYYRSKDEYDAISPCKGSINMGPPCYVKLCPSVNCAFQIETRANTITLKAEDSYDQKRWMQALMKALNQNVSTITETSGKLNHFRYSLDDLIPKCEASKNDKKKTHKLHRQNTLPNKLPTNQPRNNKPIIERLQKMGAQTYGGSLSSINKIAGPRLLKEEISKTINKTVQPSSNHPINTENLVIENDQYDKICRNPTHNDEDDLVLRRKIKQDAVYERVSSCEPGRLKSYMVDNDNYSIPIKKTINLDDSKPINFLKDNSNRKIKSFIIENDNYSKITSTMRNTKSDESLNNTEKIIDYNKNNFVIENYYNVINDENPYAIPLQNNNNNKIEPVYAEIIVPKKQKNDATVKQSQSFLRRVLKKKSKKRDNSNKEIVQKEKTGNNDGKNKLEMKDETAIEMIVKLQNVLDMKKPLLKKQIINDEKILVENKYEASTSITETYPEIPPKTISHNNNNNQPVLYENISNQDTIKSIDEILDDLNNSGTNENKSKVKQLIEKFSDEDVVLRNHSNNSKLNNERHSDELTQLLNQLSKVTSAPILTPGATSSLISSNLTDDEWFKLLPIRQRRLSEPDYDVPRPHKSIQLMLQSKEDNNKAKDVIEGTRFFGPVLPSSTTTTNNVAENEESNNNSEFTITFSMTPDSLEPFQDTQLAKGNENSASDHRHNCINDDYSSLKDLKYFSHNYNRRQSQDGQEVIYAQPKPFNVAVATHIVNISPNIYRNEHFFDDTVIYKNVKNIELADENDEVFHDSLELSNETSTTF